MSTTKRPPADRPVRTSPKTPDCGCGKEKVPRSRINDCVPCDLDRFCRNYYFTGKLLTARDLTLEQRYFRDKLRLHHRNLHGWGVVCGLVVKPHPYCPDRRIVVEPGVAIDPCGYEIVVPSPVELELPEPTSKPRRPSPCPPDEEPGTPPRDDYEYGNKPRDPDRPRGDRRYGDQGQPPEHGHDHGGHGHEHDHEHEHGSEKKYDREPTYGSVRDPGYRPAAPREYEPRYGSPKQHPEPEEPCPPKSEPCVPLTICLRYAECEEEFTPAPFDECGCNGEGHRHPNRICEGFAFEFRFEEPPRRKCCDDDDLDLCSRSLEPCVHPTHAGCIPLAFIEEYRPGETIVEERINNRDYRPVLASTSAITQALQCLLEKVPPHKLTRVQDCDWTHAQEYACRDFFKFFTGEKPGEGAFDVTFSRPVRTDALNRVFQATVVRHRGSGPSGPLELAPARAWMSADRMRLFLQIDRSWAERELSDVRFDVYLTLRCGLILDDDGRPVDGELLARLVEDDKYLVAPPTGNGIPGGTFESWILVRP